MSPNGTSFATTAVSVFDKEDVPCGFRGLLMQPANIASKIIDNGKAIDEVNFVFWINTSIF
jgi:hypothetical protein